MERTLQKISTFILIIIFFTFSLICYGEGLSTLVQLGKSQDTAARELNKETKRYEAVRSAIENGKIEKGISTGDIEKRYGEPVVKLSGKKYAEKWLYKPGWASHFDGIKIYLYFNKEGCLEGVQIMNKNK